MGSCWRLIPPLVADGITQMAVDEWLLEQHRLGLGLPCLRFYTWSGPAISLGYHQRRYPPGWHSLSWNDRSVALVRRPSGGRAVLHQGDLTYSLVMASLPGGRRHAYRQLCQFLVEGWQSLGISLAVGSRSSRTGGQASCFATATAADLVMEDGYKLIGSAQLYRSGYLLQHGSMRLRPDPALHKRVFGTAIAPPSRVAALTEEIIISAMTAAARNCFAAELALRPLDPEEVRQALRWSQAHGASQLLTAPGQPGSVL